MAEKDILNPVRGWWSQINDNPNPSYGYTRRSANNTALARARMGTPYSRETMNQGFAFEFNYVDRPWTTILRLKHFYEQYKHGYFTYVDWDGGGRHHVGRFTTAVNAMETANNKYTVQGLIFEEMPRARMLQYPADLVNWSRTINVVDDFLQPSVASFSYTLPGWVLQLNPALSAPSATDPSAYEVYSALPTVGDWAQIEYVGWGLQMAFRQDPSFGHAALYVDGSEALLMDLATGTQLPGGPTPPPGLTLNAGVVTHLQLALDTHRVKIVMQNSGAAIFPAVKVIV